MTPLTQHRKRTKIKERIDHGQKGPVETNTPTLCSHGHLSIRLLYSQVANIGDRRGATFPVAAH